MSYTYKGKILISTPDVSGDIFSRSVVLIINHDDSGAFGLILNKKNKTMSQRLHHHFGFDTDVYDGLVDTERLRFIIKGEKITNEFVEINDDFYLTEDLESIIEAVLDNRLSIQNMKIFSGYSGWTTMQLENEILRKYWTAVDVYNLDYTLPNDHNLWKNIMQNLGGEFLLWANAPEDISMN